MSDNNKNGGFEQDEYIEVDTVTLIDEDGNQMEFEHIDTMEVGGEVYVALCPVYEDPSALLDADGELVIMKVVEDEESGDDILATISDDDEYDLVVKAFEDKLKDVYEIES